MKHLVWIFMFFCLVSLNVFSQDNQHVQLAEIGANLSIFGHRPMDINSYNKDFNLVQTHVAIEGIAFYRKYLGQMFDLQVEITSGGRFLNILDTIINYRINDIYYAFNILPVLKFRDDPEQHKVVFAVAFGPSLNLLVSRKFAYPQNIQHTQPNLSFGDVITLAFASDMGIKYNYTQSSSFLIGVRGSTDFFFLNNKNDALEVKYNNFGVYVGFSGKIRKS